MNVNENLGFFLELGVCGLSVLSGFFLLFYLRKKISLRSQGLRKILTDKPFGFFLGFFSLELLFFPILSFTFGAGTCFTPVVLFAAAILLLTRLVKIYSKSLGAYVLSHLLGWTLLVFYFLGLLNPMITAFQEVAFTFGSTTFSLLGLLKASFLTGLLVWGALVFSRYFEKKIKKQLYLQPSLSLLFSKAVKTILIAISLYIGLTFLGVDLAAFSIFAGAVGVGVAFGLQNILSNFFSGFIILIDRSIKPGDVISLNNGKVSGIVNKLHARYVSVRTREGKEHLIPNQEIISHPLENWSYTDSCIRMEIGFRVSFDSDLELVERLLIDIAQNTDRVMEERAPYVRFRSMVDNAVELKLRIWVGDPENGTSGIQSAIVLKAWKVFKKNGIRVPYPPREIVTLDNKH